MTDTQLRQMVVDAARGWIGRKESDGSHKPIIDLYNTLKPLPRGYKMQYTDDWCAATVSALAVHTGLTGIMPVECSCSAMIALYKAHPESRWEENDAYVPELADIIFYDWNDSGAGENTGAPEHVGIVADVTGSVITVIEGNYSNAVKERKLQVNGRYIRGYGRPAYWIMASSEPSDFAEKVVASARTYGVIDKEAPVAAGMIDTLVILKRAIDTGWLKDGAPLPIVEVPPTTAPKETPVLRSGGSGDAVKRLQSRLNYLGYACGKADGDFGPKTVDAVRRFQTAATIGVDGEVGSQTWGALETAKPTGLLLEIKPNAIKRIEYVHGLEPVERIDAAYARIGCDVITNANFFGMASGIQTGYLADEGKVLSEWLLSKWGFEFPDQKRAVFTHWDKRTPGADFLGGYPCLLRDSNVSIDTTEAGFSATSTAAVYRRGRTAIGAKADGTFIIRCVSDVDGNRLTVPELAECMIAIGCTDAVNLDGGGSASWITANTKYITSRKLDGFLAVWLA